MNTNLRRAVLAVLTAGAIAAGTSVLAAIPNPTITPVPADGSPNGNPYHNYPMLAADPPLLAAAGYVEEEFFVSGMANCYSQPRLQPGAVVSTAPQSYKTRMIVRRPADPAKASGVVFVEWMNASNGLDIDS